LGQPAVVEIDAFPDQEFQGRVSEIGNSPIRGGGQQAVDFEVKVVLEEAPAAIRPGLTAKARVTVAERQEAVGVPLGAVTARDWPLRQDSIEKLKGGDKSARAKALEGLGFSDDAEPDDVDREEQEGVFILRDGYVKFLPVELGIAGDEHFEIIDGLEADVEVISGPFRVLRELKDGGKARKSKLKSGEKAEKDES